MVFTRVWSTATAVAAMFLCIHGKSIVCVWGRLAKLWRTYQSQINICSLGLDMCDRVSVSACAFLLEQARLDIIPPILMKGTFVFHEFAPQRAYTQLMQNTKQMFGCKQTRSQNFQDIPLHEIKTSEHLLCLLFCVRLCGCVCSICC